MHDGEPLVLMHGIGGNSLQWLSNIESLSMQYKVFAIDNINDNGRSIPIQSISNTNDYISWLSELFDELGLKKGINIVSLSYGGWIASQYAIKFPDRLNKLVLLAPVGTVAPLSLGWIARAVLVALPFK
ncbi:MAG: alpha/beta hydrolase, partial [Gammaproteobacteria bacterium]|nr:alpha/beta hydrolase [Gammaproteobacteria bacterium]